MLSYSVVVFDGCEAGVGAGGWGGRGREVVLLSCWRVPAGDILIFGHAHGKEAFVFGSIGAGPD